MSKQLAESLSFLARELCASREQRTIELEWFKSHFNFATKHDLKEMEKHIMSVIGEFAAKQKTFNDRQGTAIDSLVTSVNGLTTDVEALNDKIEELQNSTGGVTPEDQALINELQSQGEALVTRTEGVAVALKALDDAQPPVVPVVPPA